MKGCYLKLKKKFKMADGDYSYLTMGKKYPIEFVNNIMTIKDNKGTLWTMKPWPDEDGWHWSHYLTIHVED